MPIREASQPDGDAPVPKRGRVEQEVEEPTDDEESEEEEEEEMEQQDRPQSPDMDFGDILSDDEVETDDEEEDHIDDWDFEVSDDDSDDEEHVPAVPMVEALNEQFDLQSMETMYRITNEKFLNSWTTSSGTLVDGTDCTTDSVLKYMGINKMIQHQQKQSDDQDPAVIEHRRKHLWPMVFEVVRELQPLAVRTESENWFISKDTIFMENLERAVETFTRQEKLTPSNSHKKAVEIYEDCRLDVFDFNADKYHNLQMTQPCKNHKYFSVFPVQTSYNMIEYLHTVINPASCDFDHELSENQTFRPEFHEMTIEGRNLFEAHFLLDPSFRDEFVKKVQDKYFSIGLYMKPADACAAYLLFDEMNAMVTLKFEQFLIERAVRVEVRREIKRHRIWNELLTLQLEAPDAAA